MVNIFVACVNFKNKENVIKIIDYIDSYAKDKNQSYEIIFSSNKDNVKVNNYLKKLENKNIKTIIYEKEIIGEVVKTELIRFNCSTYALVLEEDIVNNLKLIDEAINSYLSGNDIVYLKDEKNKGFKNLLESSYCFIYKNFAKHIFNIKDLLVNSSLILLSFEVIEVLCWLPQHNAVKLFHFDGFKGYKIGYIYNEVNEIKQIKSFRNIDYVYILSNILTLVGVIISFIFIKITIIPIIIFLLFLFWIFFSFYLVTLGQIRAYKFNIDKDNKIYKSINLDDILKK